MKNRAVEREIDNPLTLDNLAQVGGVGLQSRRRAHNFDSFRRLAHFERHIHTNAVLDIERDACADGFLKPLSLDRYGVVTDGERSCYVVAG